MKLTHTEGSGSILKSRFARGVVPLGAALFACALAAPEARAAAPADFAKKMTLTPSTSALAKIGGSTFVNFPVLVRLPAEASALLKSANGTELLFTDEKDATLPFEVDTFDPAGETLVWVKVPSLSSATELTAYFGGAANEDNVPAAVWTNYAGVWHMNEASGTVADATGHGLTASVMGNAANSVAVAGAVGNGRQTATAAAKGYLSVPNYDRFGLGNTFTMSGWVKMTACTGYPRLFSRKANYGDANGWEMEMSSGSMANFGARGSNNPSYSGTFNPALNTAWSHLVLVYDGATLTVYQNGAQVKTGSINAATDNGLALSFGCDSDGSETYLQGAFDECRLMDGTATADGVALDWLAQSDPAFFDAGAVEDVDATAQKFQTPTVVRNADGTYTVTVVLSENSGDVGVIYDAGETAVTNIIETAANPGTYTDTPANLTAGTTYKFSAYGKNANGTEVVKAGDIFYNGDLSISKISDAYENGLVAGVFRISRADTAHDLTVTYTAGGSAAAGQTYETLSGTATIPAGSSSVDVEVVPLIDAQTTSDTIVSVTLAAGLYGIDAQAGAAELTIANLVAPSGYNTWIATAPGLASVGSNWSKGQAPAASDNILFDGRFSKANCEWDAAASATVASWTQTNDYTGVITLKTVYPGKGDFQCLTVTGEMAIHSGTITHPLSLNSTSKTWLTGAQIQEQEVYRLCLVVGGTLTVGASGAIDVKDKGHYQVLQRDCYGAHAVGYSSLGGAAAYGNPKEPIDIGMGCNGNQWAWVPYPGSGAIRITAGNVVVNGSICADAGSVNYGGHRRFTAAAGSIWINADSITGSGSITAVAVTPKDVGSNGRGSGGSIALWTKTPVSLGSPFVSAGATASGYNAPGTVFLHDQTMDKGVLVIDGMRSGNPLDYRTCVNVTTDGDWTFDEVRLQNYGTLSVPVGTTLALPGGWSSITSTNAVSAANYGVLRYEGGTIAAGTADSVVLSGRWMLTPWTNLTLNANVTVKGGAAIGVPAMAVVYDTSTTGVLPGFVSCNLSVNGDLTVESTGGILAKSCGMRKNSSDSNNGVLGFHSHGGRSLRWGKTSNLFYESYDSVFSPGLPGCTVPYPNGQTAGAAGGVVRLTVSGRLTLDGSANANGLPESHNGAGNASGGAGGAIDITAGRLVGAGSITANGGCYLWQRGPGGRVAVKLTSSGADFSSFSGTIEASGRARNDGYKGPGDASAGTVYLQTAADGDKAGTICIGQSLAESYYGTDGVSSNTNTTEMVSLGYGGDAIADYRKVKYIVRDYGRAAVNADMKAASIEIADAYSSLDLEGHTLTVKSAKVNGVKLAPGTYAAGSDVEIGEGKLGDYLVDTVTGGELIVGGVGLSIIMR